jgi:hypothetical protein
MTPRGLVFNLLTIFLSGFLATAFALNLTSTGSTVELNGIPYYIPGRPFASLPNLKPPKLPGVESLLGGLVPVTVVGTASANFNVRGLEKTIQEFSQKDDVWGEGFLSGE